MAKVKIHLSSFLSCITLTFIKLNSFQQVLMEQHLAYLNRLNSQQEEMAALLESWANINSGSENLPGLARMLSALKEAFSSLKGNIQEIPLIPRKKIDSSGIQVESPLGNALSITKHPSAPIQVFLGGHMDTVYSASSPFQKVERLDADTMRGPGVADMKGGLLIILKALEALENSPYRGKIGWEVLINPDEEIGSPGSGHLFEESALRNDAGLIFEPALPDGFLVSARKGSANFTVVARGKSAHVGRDFHLGRNAIAALSKFIVKADALTKLEKGLTVCIGNVEGGGPVNIVPDLAICRFNVRMNQVHELISVKKKLKKLIEKENQTDGIKLVLHENIERPPKLFDEKNQALFESMRSCAALLGQNLQWKPTGGVCDGNILSAAGLPTIDTLGALGGNIHTTEEFIKLNSLKDRAALTALFLIKVAAGDIILPKRRKERSHVPYHH